MVFSSVIFLCVCLPLLLTAYYACPCRLRNTVALAGSLVFYAWGAPSFCAVLILTSYVDYVCAGRLGRARSGRQKKLWLTVAVTVNLSVFLYCKYLNFFVDQVNQLLHWTGHEPLVWVQIIMPIGISFFTFQKLSYLVDVYRGNAVPARRFDDYLLYVTLFPQLIAGPIVRYQDIAEQLVQRSHTDELFLAGVWRFSVGLAKKVLLANTLATVADTAFGSSSAAAVDPYTLTCATAWVAAVCYALQLYFDFSGYSDMAIGLGKMLGFQFLENFDYPYIARSVTEFWRRWHISLSNWMREYLYIPLGGNRVASWRVYLNLWIVFLASGFWHGAAWNFVVWGALHGAVLTGERWARERNWTWFPRVLALPRTALLVLIAWVFFRAWDMPQAIRYLHVMFTPLATYGTAPVTLAQIMQPQAWLVLVVALLLSVAPLVGQSHRLMEDWTVREHDRHEQWRLAMRASCSVALLVGSFAVLVSSNFNPFIYYRF
jgi:alginate O-acetyltransferase complex protein AlgI